MNISSMSFNKKTFIPPNLELQFRELPIIPVVFALKDSLLDYKDASFFYSEDNNIIFFNNLAVQNLPSGKSKEYDTLEFVKNFIVGIKTQDCFRLSTLMLNYYYLNYEEHKTIWNDNFLMKYGVSPPGYIPPRAKDKLNSIVQNHNDESNRYLIAHFNKKYLINEYLLRDMIFRKFLVADSLRNACFPIYSDIADKNEVVGMHYKSTKYNNSCTDYNAPEGHEVYCYTSAKFERNLCFTFLHIFETPLELLKFASQIKNKNLKYARGSSHMFAVFHTADALALKSLCEKYHFSHFDYHGNNRLYIEMISSISIVAIPTGSDIVTDNAAKVNTHANKAVVNYEPYDDSEDDIPF